MNFTDAEEWVGQKKLDRNPVFLGFTIWTDTELNVEGKLMATIRIYLGRLYSEAKPMQPNEEFSPPLLKWLCIFRLY
jgi:hypothetical protein